MGSRNLFKWICADCKAETWLPKRVTSRHTRPRCSACGSIALDLATKEARDRVVLGERASVQQEEQREAEAN